MRNLTLFLPLFLLLFMLACKKDDSSNPPVDPCAGVTCLHNGVCIDGTCHCQRGWTGSNCDVQIIPTSIRITHITVTKMPATDAGGAGWDLTSGPDIYFQVKNGATVIADAAGSWVQNATVGTSWDTNILLDNALDTYTFNLYDYDDFDANDFMGGVQGKVYSSTNEFPTEIQMDCASCTVGFTLTVDYSF